MIFRDTYTVSKVQARSADIPGFETPGDIKEIYRDPDANPLWQPVLSVTLISRMADRLHVLTGKRSARGNQTHVNVASTPTIRIPSPEAGLLLVDSVPFCLDGVIDPTKPFISNNLTPSVASLPDSTDVLSFKVGALLALKIGLSDAMESARTEVGRVTVAKCVAGFSYLGDNELGDQLYEPLIMFGAVVGLNEETARRVPQETVSYSNLGWTPLENYIDGVNTKNVAEVIPSANEEDELEVCIRGLCNATSSSIVSNLENVQYHLTEEGMMPAF